MLFDYMLDPDDGDALAQVADAIEHAFPGAIPEGGVRAVRGTNSVVQLHQRYADLGAAINRIGLTADGLTSTDMDEGRNLLQIGVEGGEFLDKVYAAATEAGVPHEVVRVRVQQKPRSLKVLRDKFRPLE